MTYKLFYLASALLAYAWVKKNNLIIFLLILQGIFIDIVSIQLGANISILKIVGIIYFFNLLYNYKLILDSKTLKLLFTAIILLSLSAFFFNFISPWESIRSEKYKLIRSLKQIFTFCSEVGCIYFLANYFQEVKFPKLNNSILAIVGICLLGIYLESFFHFDYFHYFSNGEKMLLQNRVRGFTYEPRAASYYMAIIFTLSLFTPQKKIVKLLLIILSLGGIVLTKSMSGNIVLIFSFFSMLAMSVMLKTKFYKQTLVLSSIACLAIIIFFNTSYSNKLVEQIKKRSYILKEKTVGNKLEYADSAVFNFYKENPKFLLLGLGVGQSEVATQKYLSPDKAKNLVKGLTYLPFMGIFLTLANGGLLLLGILLLITFYGVQAIRKSDFSKNKKDQLIIISLLLISTYFVQVRYFHILGYAIFLYAETHNKGKFKTEKQIPTL